MIKHEEKYFCTSIYYCQKNWHEITGSFIAPFLKSRKEAYHSFYIIFSKDQGAHVKLSIYANGSLEREKNEFERNLKKYLAKHPSKEEEDLSGNKSIFMDFKTDSFYWNLYSFHNTHTALLSSEFVLRWRNVISRQIVAKLSDGEINEESSLTFIIYVQLAIASRLFQVLKEGLIRLRDLLNNLNKQLTLNDQIGTDCHLNMIMMDNRPELVELASSLWYGNSLEKDFKWLNNIRNLCDTFKCDPKDSGAVFLQMNSFLFEHLNMQNQKSVVLSTAVVYNVLSHLQIDKNLI